MVKPKLNLSIRWVALPRANAVFIEDLNGYKISASWYWNAPFEEPHSFFRAEFDLIVLSWREEMDVWSER